MKKSTNHNTRLVPLVTIITYSTILYHKNINSQYVTNVGKIMPKMLCKIFVNTMIFLIDTLIDKALLTDIFNFFKS